MQTPTKFLEPLGLVRPLEGFTYQMDTPIKWTIIGLDLKLMKWALNDPPRASESGHPGDQNYPRSVPTIGCFLGFTLPALGPALWGCPFDRCVHLIGEPF